MPISSIQKVPHYPLSLSQSLVQISATLSVLLQTSLFKRSSSDATFRPGLDNIILFQINKQGGYNNNVMVYIFRKEISRGVAFPGLEGS